MKNYILLLLLATFGMQAQTLQNPTFGNVKLKNNVTDNSATKVNVQSTDGVINTISKSDLVNVVEVNDVPSLPLIGEAGKIYVVKNLNKIYRWNGTFYQELTTDISGKEDIANKQNSLAVDGTNTKYPTVTAVNTALALKANLASPALTGTPTAPTATAGTNTTQIATTAFVLANAQSIPQLESNATDKTVWNNGKGNVSGNTSFGDEALKSNTTGNYNTAFGVSALSNNTNNGNTAIGHGALANNVSGTTNVAIGFNAGNISGVSNIVTSVFIGASALPLANSDTNEIVIGYNATGAGSNTATLGNTSITSTVLRGAVSGGSFIKSSTPATNILLAGGGDIAQNTAFNKPFGTTAGTVAEGNDGRLSDSRNPLPNSANYIQNQNSSAQSANIWISGSVSSTSFKSLSSTFTDNSYWGTTIFSSIAGDNANFAFLKNDSTPIFYSPKNTIDVVFNGAAAFGSTVTATSLPVFENNAAASSLAVGQFYRTSIGVLMVKF